MSHRLIAITGPASGRIYEISHGELTVGRHASCGLRLPEPTVSRRHALVRRAGDRLELVDLESRHGTFVNGLPVAERRLEDGDRVVIGDTTLLVRLDRQGSGGVPGRVRLTEREGRSETALSVPLGAALFLDPERVAEALHPADGRSGRVVRTLGSLLRIAAAVQRPHGTEALADELLGRLLEAVPAERAAVILPDDTGDAFNVLATRGGAGGGQGEAPENGPPPLEVSSTVLGRVIRDRAGVLAADTGAEEGLSDAESVHARGVRSLLCVPLLDFSGESVGQASGRGGAEGAGEPPVFGAIYLDDGGAGGQRFDELHLELATAVAGLVAGPLAAARRSERLERENERLQEASLGGGLVGESPEMRRVSEMISRVAPSDSTVLVRGETGTGKELTARAIHRGSLRRRGPFVAVNCASLVETLIESELFGHERGAFTGAVAQKKGQIELADGGTLFLDEVGEMPLAQQAKLLRVLEEHTVVRVGATQPRRVDVRIVAATNRDLERAVADGGFRGDLYHRLNVIALTLPPLRDRGSDVLLLARHFAHRLGAKVGRRVTGFTDAARTRLLAYDWPGNVRELANAIERAVVLGQGELIRAEDLPEALLEGPPGSEGDEDGAPPTYHQALNRLKRQLILDAVDAAGGTITRAAERLDLHPNHLHRLIRNLGLRDDLDSG